MISESNYPCSIWGTPASLIPTTDRDEELINSPRAGGKYFITRTAIACLRSSFSPNERIRARLTTWLVDQRQSGNEYPAISTKEIEEAEQKRNLPPRIRADRLLQCIQNQTVNIGTSYPFTSQEMSSAPLAAWSESINFNEVKHLLDYLCENGWLKKEEPSHLDRYLLTIEGYDYLEYLENSQDSETSRHIGFKPSADQKPKG